MINIKKMNVTKRLKKLPQKVPYDPYEYNPTGIRLTRNEIAEIIKPRIANAMTHFLNLIIPIHVKRESNEKMIAKSTYISTRRPIPNPRLNINPSPLNEIRNEKIHMIQVIRDIHPTIVKMPFR